MQVTPANAKVLQHRALKKAAVIGGATGGWPGGAETGPVPVEETTGTTASAAGLPPRQTETPSNEPA
jgi:hypothetical protein